MPIDEQKQAAAEELDRRGAFKDPDKESALGELINRGVLRPLATRQNANVANAMTFGLMGTPKSKPAPSGVNLSSGQQYLQQQSAASSGGGKATTALPAQPMNPQVQQQATATALLTKRNAQQNPQVPAPISKTVSSVPGMAPIGTTPEDVSVGPMSTTTDNGNILTKLLQVPGAGLEELGQASAPLTNAVMNFGGPNYSLQSTLNSIPSPQYDTGKIAKGLVNSATFGLGDTAPGQVTQGIVKGGIDLVNPQNAALMSGIGALGEIPMVGQALQKLAGAGFMVDMGAKGLGQIGKGADTGNWNEIGGGIFTTALGGLAGFHSFASGKSVAAKVIDENGNPVPVRIQNADGDNVTIQIPKRGDVDGQKVTIPAPQMPDFLGKNGLRIPGTPPKINADLTQAQPRQTFHATDGTEYRLMGGNKDVATVRNDATKETFKVPRVPVAEPAPALSVETPPVTPAQEAPVPALVQAGEAANPVAPTETPVTQEAGTPAQGQAVPPAAEVPPTVEPVATPQPETPPVNADTPSVQPQEAPPPVTPETPPTATEAPTGAASPIPETSLPQTTGGKNAFTRAELIQHGIDPTVLQDYPSIEQGLSDGIELYNKNPHDIAKLVMDIKSNPRTLKPAENGAMAEYKAQLLAYAEETRHTLDAAIDSKDTGEINRLRQNYAETMDALKDVGAALEMSGREWSAAGNSRKGLKKIDYANASEAVLEARRFKGEDLKPAVKKDIAKTSDALKAVQDKIDAVAPKPRQQQNKSAKTSEADKPDFGSKNTVFTADKAEAAKARLREKLGQLNAGIDPTMIPDLVEIGGYYLEGGIRQFAAWSTQMKKDAPDTDEATLQHVWAQVKAEAQQLPGAKTIPEPSNFTELLGKRMGWQKAASFLDAITDADGSPKILDKLISGDTLTAAERVQIAKAYADNAPTRTGSKTPTMDAMNTLSEIVNEGREVSRPQRMADIQAKIDDIKQQLATGNLKPLEKRTPGVLTPEQQELQDLQKQLLKERKFIESAPPPTTEELNTKSDAADAKAQAAKDERAKEASVKREAIIQGKIDDLTQQLKTGNLKPTESGAPPAKTASQQQLADLQKQVAAERRFQNSMPPATAEEIAAHSADPQPAAEAKAVQDRIDNLKLQTAELQRALDSPAELTKWEARQAQAKADRQAKADAVPVDVQKLMQQRDYLTKQVQAKIEAQKPTTLLQKVVQTSRQFKLSGLSVFAKLGGASLWAPPVEALADAFSVPFSKLPAGGGKSLGDVSAREGVFSPKAEVMGLRKMASGEALRNARDTIVNGFNSIDAQSGKDLHVDNANEGPLKYIGRLHGAMKSFLQTGQFHKSLAIRLEKAKAAGVDLTDPEEVAKIGMGAAVDAQNVKLQGDNKLADVANRVMGLPETMAKTENNPTTKASLNALSAVMRTLAPIVKIPANYIGRAVDMTGLGVARGAVTHAIALSDAAKTGEPIPADVADNILKAYKYGSMGLVAAYLGLSQPQWFKSRGFYSQGANYGTKEDGTPAEASELQIGNKTIPHVLSHNPFLEAVQFWATVRRGMEQSRAESGAGRFGSGAYQAVRGLAEEAPGMESTVQVGQALKDENSAGKAAGEYTKGLVIPQIVQQGAKQFDKDANGKVIPREQKGFGQTFQEGVPGLRNQLPVKGSTGKTGGGSIMTINKKTGAVNIDPNKALPPIARPKR